jgi:hypothetical protein
MVIEVCRWLLLGEVGCRVDVGDGARRAGDDFDVKKWDLSEE